MADTETFKPGAEYVLELVLTPNHHYWFADDFNVIVNGLSGDRYTYSVFDYGYDPTQPDKRIVWMRFQMPDAFTDVANESDFWYRPVYWGAAECITTGYDDGSFRPWNNCNRAQIITFLWRLAGAPMQYANNKPIFSDVDGDNRFYPAIMWGAATGIIGGYSDGTFRPWNDCNRMQIATFLYRYAKYENGGADVLPDAAYNANVGHLSDLPSGEEFRRAIVWADWMAIANGYSDGTFRPMNICNRAQAMTFLWRYDRTAGMAG